MGQHHTTTYLSELTGWTMDNTNILSWNTGGLNIPHKRISTLDFLQRKNIDIALLQEVHLLSKDINSLSNKYYTVIASSLAVSKTKGVAIMVKRSQYAWLLAG